MKKIISVITCCLFLVAVVRPVPVYAASIYDIPAGSDQYRYLARMYPTFGDFLQFACAIGTDNVFYEVYNSGGSPNRSTAFRFRVDSNGLSYYVSYWVFTGTVINTSLSILTLDTLASDYTGPSTTVTRVFTGFFNDYFADFPNVTQYAAVQDSIGHFKVVLFLMVGFMFIVVGRRSIS